MTRARSALDWFFRNPETGRVRVAQPPNVAILTWLAASGGALLWDERADELRWVGSGALVVWAVDELARGASPFRRTVGALVLGYQLVALAR